MRARSVGQAISKIGSRRPNRVLTLSTIRFRSTGGRWKGLTNQFRDYFVARFKAHLNIRRSGRYTFKTTSDDGSRLYVDGKQIVNNDGLHGMRARTGRVHLKKGRHAIVVDFFEYGGGAGLYVHWTGPGIRGWKLVSGSHVSHSGVQASALRLTADELRTEVLARAARAEEDVEESEQKALVGEPQKNAVELRESASARAVLEPEPVELN